MRDFRHRRLMIAMQPILDRQHHPAFVLERLSVVNVDGALQEADEHVQG
jgi:hypothetical protein